MSDVQPTSTGSSGGEAAPKPQETKPPFELKDWLKRWQFMLGAKGDDPNAIEMAINELKQKGSNANAELVDLIKDVARSMGLAPDSDGETIRTFIRKDARDKAAWTDLRADVCREIGLNPAKATDEEIRQAMKGRGKTNESLEAERDRLAAAANRKVVVKVGTSWQRLKMRLWAAKLKAFGCLGILTGIGAIVFLLVQNFVLGNLLKDADRKLTEITGERDSFKSQQERVGAQLISLEAEKGRIELQAGTVKELEQRRDAILKKIGEKEGELGKLTADVTLLTRETASLEQRAKEAERRLNELAGNEVVKVRQELLLLKTEFLQDRSVLWNQFKDKPEFGEATRLYSNSIITMLNWVTENIRAKPEWWDEFGEGRTMSFKSFTKAVVEALARAKFPFGTELERKLEETGLR